MKKIFRIKHFFNVKNVFVAILALIFFATTSQISHAQDSDFVQIVDIGAERFVNHLRRISKEIEFSDVQKTSDDFNSPDDPLHAWISFFGTQKIEGNIIFFVNGSGYVSTIGVTSTSDELLEKVVDDALICVGLSDSEIDSLKNSTDQMPKVTCSNMNRKVYIDKQQGSILLFATEE